MRHGPLVDRRCHRIAAPQLAISMLLAAAMIQPTHALAQQPSSSTDAVAFDFAHVAALRSVTSIAISPAGDRIASIVQVPRDLVNEDDGPAWSELHVTGLGGNDRPFVHGAVRIANPAFTPDGHFVAFTAKRGDDEQTALWVIATDGGEARKVIAHDTDIGSFRIAPDGGQVAFIATAKQDEAREKTKKKGFTEVVFEEDYAARRVWIAPFDPVPTPTVPGIPRNAIEPRALAVEGSVFDLEWAPDGEHLLLAVAPRPLVDDGYMAKRVRLVRIADGETVASFANPGKLGALSVAPDGRHVAMTSGADGNDPKNGRLLVAATEGDTTLRDLFPGLEGHISHLAFKDASTLVYIADIGVETELGTIGLDGSRTPHFTSGNGSPVILGLALSDDGRVAALRGERPDHPAEVYGLTLGERAKRLSDSNPWLADLAVPRQEVVRWNARDGLLLEGMLVTPAGTSGPLPLVMIVHGGPESHVRNGWLTSYSRPTHLLAARGYAVFHPNYRGSTGRGVPFSRVSQGDAAGPEFDDLIDAIDHFIETGVTTKDQVAVTGGSYGGYATAWLSTRYSDRIKAGVMFNGISNKHSKALSTDIPVEDMAVHTLYEPWTRVDFALERSPISYVAQARTPLLIAHGAADTRVNTAQSLQLYRALKLIGKTPVRMIRYPGEPHGNRRQASREDYTRRLVRWMDHFVKNGETELPPWEIDHGVDVGDDD